MSDPNEILIEQALSGYRERTSSGRILASPAWSDLTEAMREELYRRQLQSRLIESSLAPDGMSSTVRSVLSRLKPL
jgi:hypothetical protein